MLKDKILLSGEYMNEGENRWDYICRIFNESAYYDKGDEEEY